MNNFGRKNNILSLAKTSTKNKLTEANRVRQEAWRREPKDLVGNYA